MRITGLLCVSYAVTTMVLATAAVGETGLLFQGGVFPVGLNPVSVAIGDLDGDGKLDLAVANEGGDSVSVLLNQRVAPPQTCFGDADGSGAVNFADITSVLSNWNVTCTASCAGDSNADGGVNFADITCVLSNWNSACP